MDERLKQHLLAKKCTLTGEWIGKNSSYDQDICSVLEMTFRKSRYYDAVWNGMFLEFKKGKSIWLDAVRYSEMFLKVNDEASHETVTLFFVPNTHRNSIEEIVIVDTKRIFHTLNFNDNVAHMLLQLNECFPRQLNAQVSLTLKDVKKIAEWIV